MPVRHCGPIAIYGAQVVAIKGDTRLLICPHGKAVQAEAISGLARQYLSRDVTPALIPLSVVQAGKGNRFYAALRGDIGIAPGGRQRQVIGERAEN
jgi:hypothetical protein